VKILLGIFTDLSRISKCYINFKVNYFIHSTKSLLSTPEFQGTIIIKIAFESENCICIMLLLTGSEWRKEK
jgi:hypothetical protein